MRSLSREDIYEFRRKMAAYFEPSQEQECHIPCGAREYSDQAAKHLGIIRAIKVNGYLFKEATLPFLLLPPFFHKNQCLKEFPVGANLFFK